MAGRRVLTIGEVAQMCAVSPRTACMWVDTGELKGHRLVGGVDRRVMKEDLIDFMWKHGMQSLLSYPELTRLRKREYDE